MNNKTMFGSIPNMLYNGYLSNSSNYYIKISTPTSNSVWKVFLYILLIHKLII